MVIEKRDGYRRRQGLVLGFLVFFFVALQCENANAFRLSRNPLFNGMLNRRNAIPATNIANLHHHQLFKNNFNQHPFYTQQQQQQQEPAVAASSTSVVPATNSVNTNHVDPYVSGSNPVDNKEVAENPDLDQIAADAQVEQKSANLVASASSTSYSSTVGGAGAYGAGSGSSSLGSYGGISAGSGYGGISAGSGYGGISAGSGYGGISAGSGYGGGSIGSYGDTGGASYGSSGSYGGSSIGSGSSYGGFSGGSSYGSSGGSSYGIGGSTGLGGSHSSYGGGGGGGGGYGTSAPSYSISYPAQQGATKADTIHLLSSLAPSLLLSSLLLPLALALLTNTTNSLIGRKRRDLSDDYDDDDLQFSLNGDILDGDITLLDAHFFPTMDAMLESYSPDDTERLAEFVRHRGLLDIHNPCLEKLACLATTTNGKFKRYDSLKKAITLLEKSTDPDIKKRLKKGSSVGAKKERNCLTKFICKSMKSAVSP